MSQPIKKLPNVSAKEGAMIFLKWGIVLISIIAIAFILGMWADLVVMAWRAGRAVFK